LTGIEKYLGSGLVKGIGPVTANRIVAHFGLETLDIIDNQIERLIKVPGIGKKRVAQIYMQHHIMLSRNLFYTAITRARKLAIVVGSSQAIGLAVKQQQSQQKYTRLDRQICRV
jgi:ATP-dependent exoDNAse (exonuclease V) alpha subunit